MKPTPYLFFNGTCAEALAAYRDIFGGKIVDVAKGRDMPPEMSIPDDRKDWLMHAELRFDGGSLMGSDNVFGTSDAMAGVAVMVSLPTVDEAQAAFDKLAVGGAVTMPFAPTFWTAGFGRVTDRWGTLWMINCDAAQAHEDADG
ncbi:MAG: VOC family protein [Pseudomonadota bacterium]